MIVVINDNFLVSYVPRDVLGPKEMGRGEEEDVPLTPGSTQFKHKSLCCIAVTEQSQRCKMGKSKTPLLLNS